MKRIYRSRWFRILPLFMLVIALFAGILQAVLPSSSAAGTGFLNFHDGYNGYSIDYPKDWKIAPGPSHMIVFVAPGNTATCQVSIQVARKALIPRKALMGVMPQGAYSVSNKIIDGSPALAFSHYNSRVLEPGGKLAGASTQNIVVAQPNVAHGSNLYTLSLEMFQAAFVRNKNVEPHTTCESNFQVMTNSLKFATSANGLANAAPGVLTDPTNPAIIYADTHWSWTYYNHLSSDSHSYYCTGYNEQTLQCDTQPNLSGTDTPDTGKFDPGYFQPQFQCAEFVARALAEEGFMSLLDPLNSTPNDFANYQGYDLLSVDSLHQYLLKIGGVDIGNNPAGAAPGDVVFYPQHVSLLIETGTTIGGKDTIVDAHNYDAYRQPYTLNYNSSVINIVHLPPVHTILPIPPAVLIYNNTNYSGTPSFRFEQPGTASLPQFTTESSILVPPGWTVLVFQSFPGVGMATLDASVSDLSKKFFDGTITPLQNNIATLQIHQSLGCFLPSGSTRRHTATSSNSCGGPPPQDCPNTAAFISDVTYPDGAPATPGQAFDKTWQLQNTSQTCTWKGFTLNFVSGAQMGGPPSVSVPETGPGQTQNITVHLTAPSNSGTYRGNWQLENNQGVDVSQGGGGTVWVEISVPYSIPNSNGADSISASYPTVVTPGQHFQPQVTVQLNSGQLLQSRGDMLRNADGNLYGAWPFVAVNGTVNAGSSYVFTFYANNPIVAPSSEGTYSSVWQLWQNGGWVGQTYTITFTVKIGGGTRPNTPTLTSPGNWDFERGGATPTLCASSTSSNIMYDIQISQGQSTPDSGWINANCWTPPTLGPYTFAWHAKVRDNSSGLESGWSDTWNFSIASQQLTMDPITFSPPSPSAPDGVYVRSCVHGFGDVNLGLSYEINSATDGTANGEWHGFSNAGNNCPDPNNPSTWGQFPSRDYADGDHLVRATGFGPQGQTMIMTASYHLNHRKPQDVQLISPVNNVRVNSDAVTFVWRPSLSAQSYQLVISANSDMSSPLFNQNVGNMSSYQYTFSQDLSPAYWQVTATNDVGQTVAQTSFGIDRVAPTASVTALAATTPDSTFSVTWSGSDNDAGVQWYNVQYRDGNDPAATWVNWQTNTAAIAALFTGSPGHTYYFRAQAMDKASNLSAYAGGDGDTHTLLDLNARPQTPWWNTSYSGKRNAIILNNDTQTLPGGYPIHLHFDTSTTPTASDIFSSSLAANAGDDVRIVYQDTTELSRYLANFSATQVDIWFDLQATIAPNPATDTTSYQIYYGNAGATNPPGDPNSVFPPGLDSNVMGVWYFQDGSGSNLTDSSGRGHTGTLNNGSWTSNGKFGPSVVFNGSSSTVNLGDSSDFDLRSFTLEGWFKFYAPGIQDLIRRDNSNRNGDSYNLGTRDGKIEYGINGRSPLRSHTQFQANRWYHIAATYDGTTMAIYINGVLDASQTDTGGTPPSVGPLMLGDNRVNSDWFNGEMQGIRISNFARTSFPYGSFANIVSEPSTNAGSPIAPPQTGTPSLAVQGVDVIAGPNGTNTFVVNVQNQGTVATGNGFATDLYLNHQPSGPGDYTGSVNSWVASPIDSNQNITLAATVSGPGHLSVSHSGIPTETTQTFYVQADSSGALVKYDQPGQTITGPITVCTASPDAYQPDNSPAAAAPIAVNGVAQVHNFNVPGIQDWVSFTAKKGVTYVLSTSQLGANADTVLALYGSDGATLLASSNDYNGTPGSLIDWKAPAAGTYYIQVTNWSPYVGGCGTDYNLAVQQSASIASTPATVGYNQVIKVTGKAFAANESVNLYLDSIGTAIVVTATASSSGFLSTSFRMPQLPLGTHTIYAVGQTSKKVAITPFQATSKAVLSKGSGAQGAPISLTAYSFLGVVQDEQEVVNVYWGSPTGTLLGSSPTNGQGTTGAINFNVPVVPPGTYALSVVGQASGVTLTVPFKVLTSKPTLAITPGSGTQGSAATTSGTGFGANETVTIEWNCASKTCASPTVLATATTDATGNFSGLGVTIPSPVAIGKYAIGAVGGTSGAFVTTQFTVTSNQLLQSPWHLTGNNGAAEAYQSTDVNVLKGMNTIRITYNLHGLQALSGDASAIIIDQNGWHYISLSNYGQNGLDGMQTVDIPLSDFPGLDLTKPIDGTIHTRFWYSSQFTVDITSIVVYHK